MKANLKKVILSLCLSAGLAAVVLLGFWLWTLIPPKSYSAQEIYEMAAPSVVEVSASSYKGDSVGTGFFYDDLGTVITSYRVIKDSAAVNIKTYDGQVYEVVSVRGYDEARDIAVLDTRCKASKPLPLRADKLQMEAGEPAYVIGSTSDMSDCLSEGVISGIAKEVGGQTFMEITAEVSLQAVGAPLMDKYGNIVGISTYTFVDGEKMNLALPIGQLELVGKNSPTLLSELFKQEYGWVFDYDLKYDEEQERFVLMFQLGDEKYNPILSSGNVEINIRNDDGILVYKETLEFDESDYSTWPVGGRDEEKLVVLYIDLADITKGITPRGTVRAMVHTESVSFEEFKFTTDKLPYKKVAVPN